MCSISTAVTTRKQQSKAASQEQLERFNSIAFLSVQSKIDSGIVVLFSVTYDLKTLQIRSKSHQDLNRSAEAISYGLDSDLLPKPKLAGSTDDLLTSPRGAKIVSQKGVEKVSQFLKSLEELPVEEENTEVGDTFLHSSHQNLTYEGGKLTSELTKSVPPATVNDGYLVANINRQPSISTGIGQFLKKPMGQFVVNFDFLPTCPQDLAVTKGQVVTALNCDDPDWIFVRTASGHEGFVPHNYISPFDQSAKGKTNHSFAQFNLDF